MSELSKFLIDKNINIPKRDWKLLNDRFTKDELKDMITKEILDGNICVPMREITINDARNDYIDLVNHKHYKVKNDSNLVSKFEYKYPFSGKYITDTLVGGIASDYFQQYNRWCCEGKSQPAPINCWNDEKSIKSILNAIWSLKYDYLNRSVLTRCVTLKKYVASQFRPSIAKLIYETCKSKDVLDFSSGWGDRLCGFYASNCTKSYIGIDPNINTYNKYFEQANFYETISGHKDVTFYNSPAEDLTNLEENIVDTIFTSPPYFDAERYTQDDNQSWKRYQTCESWLNDFMFKTIDNVWKALKPNGYFILNISDVTSKGKRICMCDPMNDYLLNKGGSFVDCIGMRVETRPHIGYDYDDGVMVEPIWIWQKSDTPKNPFNIEKKKALF